MSRRPSQYSSRWFADRYGITVREFDIQRVDWAAGRALVQFLRPASAPDESRLWSGLERDRTPNQWLAKKGGMVLIVIADTAEEGAKIQRALLPDAVTAASDGYAWVPEEIPGVSGLRAAARRFDVGVAERESEIRGLSLVGVYQANFEYGAARSIGERQAQVSVWVPRRASDLPELARRLGELPRTNRRILSGNRSVALIFSATPQASDLLAATMQKKGYLDAAGKQEPPPAVP